ncbi:MAG: helix-turn-helix transcriptional regulator [Methylocella sp.]
MGAVEHLKTLCCFGLKPESAMIALTPVLHEIIPHGWTRWALLGPDATIGNKYAEHPGAEPLYNERLWRFLNDPSSRIGSVWLPKFKAAGIGWALHLQGRGWLEDAFYREIEAPLDSCWYLDAMIAGGGRTIAFVHLTRPRGARPFTVDDVQRLDRLRPWLAHALRRPASGDSPPEDQDLAGMAGAPVRSGQMILTLDAKIVFQTTGLEFLLRILAGEPADCTRYVPVRDRLPVPILKLLRCIGGAANGTSNTPPRMQVSSAYGVLTLEAKWLGPAGTIAADVAKDPKACIIAVTIELREHAIAHAARILRESGATPAQVKVGIQLALGKTKPVIAEELGVQFSSVDDLTRKLYQTLDVHNAAELSTKIWLGEKSDEARHYLRRAG